MCWARQNAAVPVVIEQLTQFEKHAAAYVAAVELLPDTIDSDTLVRDGVAAVSAYATAQTEAAYLNKVSWWVAGTRNLPGFAGRDVEPVLRILRPADAVQLAKLDAAKQHTNMCREDTAVKISACTTRRRPESASEIIPIRPKSIWHSTPGSPSTTGTVPPRP
jgi:hypothetical protein